MKPTDQIDCESIEQKPIMAEPSGERDARARILHYCVEAAPYYSKELSDIEFQLPPGIRPAVTPILYRRPANTVSDTIADSVDSIKPAVEATKIVSDKPKTKPTVNGAAINLDRTFGFEMTALANNYTENRNGEPSKKVCEHTDKASWEIGKELRRLYGKKFAPDSIELAELEAGKCEKTEIEINAFTDVHCAEWPSPVFTNWRPALKFYRTVRRLMKKHKLKPKDPATVCGGGHLHFGFSAGERDLLVKSYNYLQQLYFLPWVFTQPDDTVSSNSPESNGQGGPLDEAMLGMENYSCRDVYLFAEGLLAGKPAGYVWTPSDKQEFYYRLATRFGYCFATWAALLFGMDTGNVKLGNLPNPKSTIVAVHTIAHGYSLEYRCVEAPNDEKEFADQVYFFNKLTQALPRLVAIWTRRRVASERSFQFITTVEAIRDFRNLCGDIGVTPSRYTKYVERNLLPRWELGRRRY